MFRLKHTRESYIPKGSTKIADKKSTAVCYLKEGTRANGDTYFWLVGFDGRKNKPVINTTYRSKERALGAIGRYFESCQLTDAYRAKRQEERKAPHKLKVGDVLTGSWGYEQTNPEAYQVVEVVGKSTVKLRQLHLIALNANSDMSQYVMPDIGNFAGDKVITRRASSDNSVKLHSSCYLSPWRGNKMYHSWYG